MRFKVTQGSRVLTQRWGGPAFTHNAESGASTYDWWTSPNGTYLLSLPKSGPYRIAWTWAWCWRVPPLTIPQECEADEP